MELLVADVPVDNHEEEPLLAPIGRMIPDVVLLVETDAWWTRASVLCHDPRAAGREEAVE